MTKTMATINHYMVDIGLTATAMTTMTKSVIIADYKIFWRQQQDDQDHRPLLGDHNKVESRARWPQWPITERDERQQHNILRRRTRGREGSVEKRAQKTTYIIHCKWSYRTTCVLLMPHDAAAAAVVEDSNRITRFRILVAIRWPSDHRVYRAERTKTWTERISVRCHHSKLIDTVHSVTIRL